MCGWDQYFAYIKYMGHIEVGGWVGPVLRYVQYMGHTLSNVLVKYIREHSGDIYPIHEQYYGSSMSHISFMLLAIY